MKIKRFFGRDMRQAMARIRDEQGSDAVILSTTEVEGGIEVISAVDYDAEALKPTQDSGTPKTDEPARVAESDTIPAPTLRGGLRAYLDAQEQRFKSRFSHADAPKSNAQPPRSSDGHALRKHLERPVRLAWSQDPAITQMRRELEHMRQLLQDEVARLAWNDYARRDPVRALAVKRLRRLGFSTAVVKTVIAGVRAAKHADEAYDQAIFQLTRRVPVAKNTCLDHGGVVAMIGPTGVGKTTSIAKLAARFCMRHGAAKVGLITADMHRIGAHRQLASYAQILNVPLRIAREESDIDRALEALADRRLVLIDTTGLGQRDTRLAARLRRLAEDARIETCLVLSAQAQAKVQSEVLDAFRLAKPATAIVTKLDECDSLGGVLSAIMAHRLPLSFVCDGQRVPEDLHRARAESLVRYAMGASRKAVEPVKQPRKEASAVTIPKYSYA